MARLASNLMQPCLKRWAELYLAKSSRWAAQTSGLVLNALVQTPFQARRPMRSRIGAPSASIDLGAEPPLTAFGGAQIVDDRRRVSLRWLLGTVLTGLTGASLLGIAMFAAFDRRSSFPAAPDLAVARPENAGGPLVNPRKGDRLVRPRNIVAAKHSFRAAVTATVGQRQVVRIRSFTRVATPLTLVSLGFADQIPPFNPLRLLAQGDVSSPPPDPGPAPDVAEVSFEIQDLSAQKTPLSQIALTLEDAREQVADYLRAMSSDAAPSLALPSQLLMAHANRISSIDPAGGLAYASASSGVAAAPFTSIKVRMIPENVTSIPETAPTRPADDEKLFTVRHDESLDDVLRLAGVPDDQTRGLAQAFGLKDSESPVAEGERVRLQFLDFDGTPASRRLARVSIYSDETLRATAALDDAGAWDPVQKAPSLAETSRAGPDDDDDRAIRLYDSLFETALKQGVSRATIDDLVRIFSNDVDFQAPVAGGDSFDVLYANPEQSGSPDALLYASITTHNETFKYYRFRAPDSGRVDFYDEKGRATHKFLVREPVFGARLTSPFGMRSHPILGYTRMHTGVDLAAPTGTPVYAAGSGLVIKAGRESGYGNRVEIQHINGYVTTYSHMSGFARGLAAGVHVTQGQVIGYLGMTGLATGPHLHYEVIVNGHFVDPLRVKLAQTRELAGSQIVQFEKDRERIDGLLAASADGSSRVAEGGG